MSELLQVLDTSLERGPQSLKVTPPPAIMPSVLTTRAWPVRQNTYDISHPAQQRAGKKQLREMI